jgi:glycosyltransferase involved in cell wall biosynthesis
MWHGKRVSVVLPAFNEAGHIAQAIREFQRSGVVDELLVVDNISGDDTGAAASAAGATVIIEQRQGYGYTCQRALREASGELIVLAEPDGTFLGRDILKLLAYADDFQLVLGTRTSRLCIWEGANMGLLLKWGNWAVAKMLQALFNGPSLTDVGCTMRLIHREALRKIQRRFSVGGSHFSPEMMILALCERMSVVEIPVNYCARVGQSKITGKLSRAARVGARMIMLILWYRFAYPGHRALRLRQLQQQRQALRRPAIA